MLLVSKMADERSKGRRCGPQDPSVFSPEMRVPQQLFMAIVPVSVWFSSRPWLNFATRPLMRGLAAATMRIRKAQPQTTVEAMGEEWQRMFPSRKSVPITSVENDTVYAEIHITCPHRGTGNVEGCYRMMEYDRKMLERIGGQFVVLRSQAEPGVEVCQVAMRKADVSVEDLVPAHVRARRGSRADSG
jgi:hypothetical protein